MRDKNTKATTGTKADIEAAARLAARAANQDKSTARLQLGRQRGLYDNIDLRRSVHQWQATGEVPLPPSEADALDEENCAPDEEPAAAPLDSSGGQPAAGSVDFWVKSVSPAKPAASLFDPANQPGRTLASSIGRELRAATLPKKRIVSDEHWMHDRGRPPTKDNAKAVGETERPRRPDAWVRPRAPQRPAKETRLPPEPVQPLEKGDVIKYLAGASTAYKAQHAPHTPGRALVRERPSPAAEAAARAQAKAAAEAQKDAAPPLDPATVLSWLTGAPKTKTQNANGLAGNRVRAKSQGAPQAHAHAQLDKRDFAESDRISSWLGATSESIADTSSRHSDSRVRTGRPKSSPIHDEREQVSQRRDDRDRRKSRSHADNQDSRYSRGVDVDDAQSSPQSEAKLRRRPAQRSKSRLRAKSMSAPTTDHDGSEISDRPRSERPHRASESRTSRTLEHSGFPQKVSRGTSEDRSEAEPKSRTPKKVTPVKLSQRTVASLDKPGLARRLTTHDDLMSVLSVPRGRTKSTRSVRSAKVAPVQSFQEVVTEFGVDEGKYLRELKTLVDGVIPVLLKAVLSTNTKAAKKLFGPAINSANATTPIVNMGIALERLKSAHKRVQLESEDVLLAWAKSTHRIYEDYLKAWRLGFQDVVVNLAPADNTTPVATSALVKAATSPLQDDKTHATEDETATDEKADVAFLLKRPLVRLKYLSKTLKALEQLQNPALSTSVAAQYQALVAEARRRQTEERARLEDEAASGTDATKARDISTLAPLAGISINPLRCVKARDLFDLKLQHSSGQVIDCRVELILRYERLSQDQSGGDLLVCEVDSSSRWLLFPPITVGRLSARHAPNGNLVAMIRGKNNLGREWHELLDLRPVETQAVRDWVQMLGTSPAPLDIPKVNKFVQPTDKVPVLLLTDAAVAAVPSEEIQVPIGEQASVVSSSYKTRPVSSFHPMPAPLNVKDKSAQRHSQVSKSLAPTVYSMAESESSASSRVTGSDSDTGSARSRGTASHVASHVASHAPRSLNEAMLQAGTRRPGIGRDTFHAPVSQLAASELSTSSTPHDYNMVRTRVQGHSRYRQEHSSERAPSRNSFSVWMPTQSELDEQEPFGDVPAALPASPSLHHRTSSVPVAQTPVVLPRSRPRTPVGNHQRILSEAAILSSQLEQRSSLTPQNLARQTMLAETELEMEMQSQEQQVLLSTSPPVVLSTPVAAPRPGMVSSSPLKQQYIPDQADEGDFNDDSSLDGQILTGDDDDYDDEDDISSITSSSSADDMLPSLAPSAVYAKNGLEYLPKAAVAPLQLAPQALKRRISIPFEHDRTIASLFTWSDKGSWQTVHNGECSIVISPGLIEAFEFGADHSYQQSPQKCHGSPKTKSQRPLVALELTPLVPLRRGTALDISIRSPPTSESILKPGNNIMFRCRTAQECERLYGMINQARINNPTYIALQNARPGAGFGGAGWSERMGHQRGPSSWLKLGRKGSSYRAGTSTRRSPSYGPSAAQTESSVASMSSAIMALKRFSGSKMFNVAKSTITSRAGGRSASSADMSSSSGGASGGFQSGTSTPLPAGLQTLGEIPMGVTSTKMRLYYRESASKWRDMGSAQLTIVQPPRAPGTTPSLNRDGSVKKEMRIIVLGKHRGETLLDVTLGEGNFERVARTGIAVSMVEQHMGENGEVGVVKKTGGVLVNRQRVYMLQMRSEAETAYAFSLVGRLRY